MDESFPHLENGHTLLELLATVATLGLILGLACISLVRGLEVVGARTAAQSWQSAAAQAQLTAAWEGSSGSVLTTPRGIASKGRQDTLFLGVAPPPLTIGSNVRRWGLAGAVHVTFAQGFGTPDSGGSIRFGDTGWGTEVVVRVESGWTRRTAQ